MKVLTGIEMKCVRAVLCKSVCVNPKGGLLD